MKDILGYLFAFVAIVLIAYGSWRIERYVHYKWSYQAQVQAEIKPLQEQVNALEARVKKLESK